MYHIFFIHSSVVGLLSCFHILPVGNSASVNTGVHVSLLIMFYPDICLGLGLHLTLVLLKGAFHRSQRISKALNSSGHIDHDDSSWAPFPPGARRRISRKEEGDREPVMIIHPKQRGKAAENHIQPHNHQAARSQVVPTSHPNDGGGDTSRHKSLFRKCFEITFQKMAFAVVVINDHLSLQNIHQCNTQGFQVMQRENIVCKHEVRAGLPSTH